MLNSAYGQGLNHLLNEESDKATEILIQMVEVDPDTIELHMALGSLFRRRGEVDRAIRVHQNIVARSRLSDGLREQATLELGRDFLRAGLLDRAEKLFVKLLDGGSHERETCQHLVDLYQQQKEWRRAIEFGQRLAEFDADAWRPRIAQYYCELAEMAMEAGEIDAASAEAGEALAQDRTCVRATLITARACQSRGDYQRALAVYAEVERQDPALLTEAMEAMRHCYMQLGELGHWQDYVEGLVTRHPRLVLSDSTLIEQRLQQLIDSQARYCCEKCGFSSKRLFWQCPGCRCWNSVKPIQADKVE